MCAKPVIVADVDTGIDDSLALTYLAHLHARGEIELRVTTSAGNCTSAQAACNSRYILDLCGVDIPVQAGAAQPVEVDLVTTPETHGPYGLGYAKVPDQYALADSLASPPNAKAAVQSWGGADGILLAGPATNAAWAATYAPEILSTAQICIMGGSFDHPGNTTATAEWNAWVDPHALALLCDTQTAMIICGLNVTEHVELYPDRLARWATALKQVGKQQLAAVLQDALRFYFEFHRDIAKLGYFAQIHDLAAAQILIGRVAYDVERTAVAVATAGELRGTTTTSSTGLPQKVVRHFRPADVFAEFERVVCAVP
ncbi:MAG: nucleoside hydrolase [Corynebacterium sp.]|nr:nucleoside hydrolase [Corynebacterium sp.]